MYIGYAVSRLLPTKLVILIKLGPRVLRLVYYSIEFCFHTVFFLVYFEYIFDLLLSGRGQTSRLPSDVFGNGPTWQTVRLFSSASGIYRSAKNTMIKITSLI